MGPLLSSAILIERLVAGNDTLIIDFTEPVNYTTVKGLSLTLLKKQGDGSFAAVQLEVLQAQPDTNGHSIIAVFKDLDDNSPKEGDSLRITPGGPIVDGFNNGAHPLNRPVLLTSRSTAPDIVNAIYQDLDADGMIDNVRITFNKSVTTEYMKMQFNFNGKMGLPAENTNFTMVGMDNTVVDVNISTLFNVSDLKDRTSGNCTVTILLNDYSNNNVKNAVVMDGAAPVLASVEYRYGNIREPMEETDLIAREDDTVVVQFSEALASIPSVNHPFLFKNAHQEYNVIVKGASIMGGAYRFIVDSAATPLPPVKGDSAWINTAEDVAATNVKDNSNNVQAHKNNKRVPVVVVGPLTVINPPDSIEKQPGENTACGNCGSGTILAFVPPVFFYARRHLRKKTRQKIKKGSDR